MVMDLYRSLRGIGGRKKKKRWLGLVEVVRLTG